MKKAVMLLAVGLLVMLVVAPAVFAQDAGASSGKRSRGYCRWFRYGACRLRCRIGAGEDRFFCLRRHGAQSRSRRRYSRRDDSRLGLR